MKKISLFICALVCATSLMAETVKIDGLYYSLGNTTATLVQDQSSDKSVYGNYINVTVPASVYYNNYNYPVTSLGTSAFESCTNLQSVTLPSSITLIGTDAFYGCSKLGSVNLPEGLTTINMRAFYNCHLDTIIIPSTVTSIGSKAFYGCPIKSVTWLPINCSIGTDDSAPFYSTNSQITSFTFGDQVQVIPAYLCKNMSLLDTIVLPPSVNSLGTYAFAFCTRLKSINLPVTQQTLPVSFLEGCTSLESIELPATLTTISTDAFYGCTKLANVNLHEGITTINQRAFYNCKLTDITIPSTVTSIGNGAFKGNPITSVTWLPKNSTIGSDDSAPFYSTNSQITSFTFGDSVQIVPSYLCKNMSKLETVVLPSTVTNIGQCAFMYCTSLKSFEFPQGIKIVATSVLEGCTALQSVVIPSSVTSIYQDAFYGCSGLQEIHNFAFTPQTITERSVSNVNKHTCILYVPMDYINLYRTKAVWCDFDNIIGVQTDLQFEDQIVNVTYLKQDSTLYYMESQTWAVPHEPHVEGFTFVGWQVQQGMLSDGIVLVAVYQSNDPTNTSDVVENPNNKAQKLIRQGNVYILQDDQLYTIQGQKVK